MCLARKWAALLFLTVALAAAPRAAGLGQLPLAEPLREGAAEPQPEAAANEAAPAASLQRQPEFEAGTSTLVDLIDGPRAGERVRCTVLARGELPETYHVRILSGVGAGREVHNVPSELLQRREEAMTSHNFRIPAPVPLEVLDAAKWAQKDGKQDQGDQQRKADEEGLPKQAEALLSQRSQQTKEKDFNEAKAGEKDEADEGVKDSLEQSRGKEWEEEQRERIRRTLGLGKNSEPPPEAAEQPWRASLEEAKRQRQEEVEDRRTVFKKRHEALVVDRKKKVEEETKRQAALRLQRKAYWSNSKAKKLHITLRGGDNSTGLPIVAPRSLGLRAVLVTAVDRLGLVGAEVRLSYNGTRLEMDKTLGAAGLHDHDVVDVEAEWPAERKVETTAAPRAELQQTAESTTKPPPARLSAATAAATKAKAPKKAQRTLRDQRSVHEVKHHNIEAPAAPAPWAEPRAARPAKTAGSPAVDYEVGDFMEIKIEHTVRRLDEEQLSGNWIPCTITGKGTKPNTYTVHFPVAPKQQPDITDVPASYLRMVEAQNWAQKIKRMRQEPEIAREAIEQAIREADRRKRLKEITTRLKGSAAMASKAAEVPEKRPAPANGAAKRPLAPMARQGILPQPSSLGEKHPSLTRRH